MTDTSARPWQVLSGEPLANRPDPFGPTPEPAAVAGPFRTDEGVAARLGAFVEELKDLATVIASRSALLVRDLPDADPVRGAAAEIARAAGRAVELTHELHAAGRFRTPARQSVCLNQVVADLARMFWCLLQEDVEMSTSLEPNLGPVSGDRGRLEGVVLNLILNARDAMPGGGRLHLATGLASPRTPPGRYVTLAVTDTGGGHAGRAPVEEAVEGLGGFVRVESCPGLGSTFTVYLRPAESVIGDQSKHRHRPVLTDH
jgi:signal transduction histidine kinase